MWKLHTKCRACGSDKLNSVFSLGLQPLANAFAKPSELQSAFYPLEVLFCPLCTLGQLSCTVPPSTLYSNYPYVTSKSETMQAHFESLWKAIKSECEPESVCEIGSNDGDFLNFARANGAVAICGIDPAENLAEEADRKGIQTFRGVLDQDMAKTAFSAMPVIDLVVARHVFCHVDDWQEFVKSLEVLCNKNTLVVIEVPYVLDLLKNVEFDTIYHEHTSYLSIKAMQFLLEDSPFQMHKVIRFPIHGGAICIMLRHRKSGIDPHDSVSQMLHSEQITEDDWNEFGMSAHAKIDNLRELVLKLKADKKSIVGYGASAKATVWLNSLKLSRDQVAFVCDSTSQKQNRFVPGADIPIVDPGALTRELPDYAICWAWNFFREIQTKEVLFREKGGKWIVPVPELKIV